MKKESKDVERSEILHLYSRNQFIREFQRTIETDESRTLKYQMVDCSSTINKGHRKLRKEWQKYKQTLNDLLINNFIEDDC